MDKVFMSFIELVINGGWQEAFPPFETANYRSQNLAGSRVFIAGTEAELQLVEPEVVIRRFAIRFGAIVAIGSSMVALDLEDITSELSVDEDVRDGKRLKLS
jgi:hypothetical protein